MGAPVAAALAAASVSACSSSPRGERSEFGPTYNERMAAVDKIVKQQDFSQRSAFERQMPAGMTDREFRASTLTSREASGMKSFAGAGASHQTKTFADSERTSRAAAKSARETREQSRLASKLFRMPDNPFTAGTSTAASKSFQPARETFATRSQPTATAELERNRRPVIVDPEKPTYSESEVKRLLEK